MPIVTVLSRKSAVSIFNTTFFAHIKKIRTFAQFYKINNQERTYEKTNNHGADVFAIHRNIGTRQFLGAS